MGILPLDVREPPPFGSWHLKVNKCKLDREIIAKYIKCFLKSVRIRAKFAFERDLSVSYVRHELKEIDGDKILYIALSFGTDDGNGSQEVLFCKSIARMSGDCDTFGKFSDLGIAAFSAMGLSFSQTWDSVMVTSLLFIEDSLLGLKKLFKNPMSIHYKETPDWVKVCAFLVSMFDNKALRGVFEECGVFGKVCNAGNVPSTILKSIWDQAKALLVAWSKSRSLEENLTKQKERLKEGVGKVAELLDSEIQILKEQLKNSNSFEGNFLDSFSNHIKLISAITDAITVTETALSTFWKCFHDYFSRIALVGGVTGIACVAGVLMTGTFSTGLTIPLALGFAGAWYPGQRAYKYYKLHNRCMQKLAVSLAMLLGHLLQLAEYRVWRRENGGIRYIAPKQGTDAYIPWKSKLEEQFAEIEEDLRAKKSKGLFEEGASEKINADIHVEEVARIYFQKHLDTLQEIQSSLEM